MADNHAFKRTGFARRLIKALSHHPPDPLKFQPLYFRPKSTSKKGVAGFGSPNHFFDISRSSPQNLRLLHFCLQFWRLGWGASAPPVLAGGSRSTNPFELPPPFGSGCVSFCKLNLLEAIHC